MNRFKENRFLKNLSFAAVVILIYKLIDILPWSLDGVRQFIAVISPIIAGFIIAFMLCVPCEKLEKLLKKTGSKNFFNKHSRGFSVLAVYIVFVLIVALLIYAIIPIFVKNVLELADNIPSYYDQISSYVNDITDQDGKIFGIPVDLKTFFNEDLPAGLKTFFNTSNIPNLIKDIGVGIVSAVASVFISVIMSVYMLLQRESLISACGKILGIFMRGRTVSAIHDYLRRISEIFYNYIYGQLLDALAVSVVFMIVLWIIGVPYAVFFALFIGICNLIPYFGAIIGGVIVCLVTLATKGFTSAIITAVCILVIQQLDGNILQPRIVGKQVGIKPIYVLFAITVGGGFFGFLGILISVPVVATLRMIAIDLIDYTSKKRQIEREAAAAAARVDVEIDIDGGADDKYRDDD